MTFAVEIDREEDGRWIAEVPALPGVLAYGRTEEEAKAKEVGLRYVHIPVNWRELKDEYAVDFLKATDDQANRPAFIHCATANRVGAFWMIRRVLRDGWTLENAEEEARKIGLRNETLLAFAKDYISHGLRGRAAEIITFDLGPRTDLEVEMKLHREMEQERFTSLDGRLLTTADPHYIVPAMSPDDPPRALHADAWR